MSRWEVALELADSKVSLVTGQPREFGLWVFHGASAQEVLPMGADRQDVLDVIAGVHPSASLGSPGGVTPLAGSVCDAVQELIDYEPAVWHSEIIELFSDGLENATPPTHACHGPDSVSAGPNYDLGSWQWKVLNMARTGNPNSPSDPPLPLIVNVDHLFDNEVNIFSAGFSSARAVEPLESWLVKEVEGAREASPLLRSLQLEKAPIPPAVVLAPAAAVLQAVQFYGGLTQSTGGTYRAVNSLQYLPQNGDVTGDHCVDQEDQNQILLNFGQSVWPNDPSDTNADGTIDIYDWQNVAQNFGEGC